MHFKLAVAFALLALSPACLGHTYFKAEQVPFGDQAPDAPDASAALDLFIHEGAAYWKLNLTGVEGFKAAKIVFGTPEVATDEIVTYYELPVAANSTTDFIRGSFNATDFAPGYEAWTVDTLGANAGLDHIWAVLESDADYDNVLLSGKVTNYKPAEDDN